MSRGLTKNGLKVQFPCPIVDMIVIANAKRFEKKRVFDQIRNFLRCINRRYAYVLVCLFTIVGYQQKQNYVTQSKSKPNKRKKKERKKQPASTVIYCIIIKNNCVYVIFTSVLVSGQKLYSFTFLLSISTLLLLHTIHKQHIQIPHCVASYSKRRK